MHLRLGLILVDILLRSYVMAVNPCLLATTLTGHFLLDAYESLAAGFPPEWHIVAFSQPPTSAYSASVERETRPRKRRKARPEFSTNNLLNIAHHDRVTVWLEPAIGEVRNTWLSKAPTSWYSTKNVHFTKNRELPATQDLVAWADATGELQEALLNANELTSVVSLMGAPCTCCRLRLSSAQAKEIEAGHTQVPMAHLFQRIYTNTTSIVQHIRAQMACYVIPPRSAFLMSDMMSWKDLLVSSPGIGAVSPDIFKAYID